MEQCPDKSGLADKSTFYGCKRLVYGFDRRLLLPTMAHIPFETVESKLRNPAASWLRFPTVAAATSETTAENPEPSTAGGVGFFSELFRTHDDVKKSIVKYKTMFDPVPGETGWDRMRTMYSLDQFGNLGPEWQHVFQGFYMGALAGGVIGFFYGGRNAAERFVARNEGTKFLSEMAARRALQDKMMLGMASYAWKWGWRMAAFTTLYLFTAANFSVYRGNSSALDYMAAGGVTGAFWKFLQGPRAMLVAGSLGSVLGLVAGGLSLTILRASGMSMEEMRYWHYQTKLLRQGEVIGKVVPPANAVIEDSTSENSSNKADGMSTKKT